MPAPEKVEVNAAELELLNRSHKLLDSLWNDPKLGFTVKKMVESKTGVKSPELAMIETITAGRDEALSQINKRLDAQDKARADEAAAVKAAEQARAEADLLTRVSKAKKDYSFTDEGMERVFTRMREQNSADVEGAAAYIASQLPKAKPVNTGSPYAPQAMNMFGVQKQDENWAELNRDPVNWFDTKVGEILAEFENAQ